MSDEGVPLRADMTTIATTLFQFRTGARPDQVWSALTRPDLTPSYLFGMAVESDWRAGSAVVVQAPPGAGVDITLCGEVVVAEESRRLSFTLCSGPAAPATFVTWAIEPMEDGANVSLYVDETQLPAGSNCESEAAWRQAVTALQATLARLLR